MSHKRSFTITLSNNRTEREGIAYLLQEDNRFLYPDLATRKRILKELDLDRSFARAFDLIMVEGGIRTGADGMAIDNIDDIVLVELKTTKKKLADSPRGFFFGATENEINLAKKLGNRFRFAFVCLHPETPSHVLLTWAKLESLIKNMRIQYQINLIS